MAEYLSQLCHTIAATVAVEIIVLGGGVMQTPGLIDAIQNAAEKLDRGYLPIRTRQRIVLPEIAQGSGVVGSLLLSELASRSDRQPR